ncbi:nephrin [Megalops cyprinoides]|uniref:nephrin n=1 Tax=Megalops cyprinoides TaxID=118141 RepID=UPI0018652B05|nr:nephrin [Megalops cyprinoides]
MAQSLIFLEDERLREGVRSQQAFRTQPKNVTAKAGATVVLKCEVLRPSGVVQWAKDGFLLGPQRDLPGFPRYRMIGNEKRGQYHLQIEKVALEDDSPYECQVGRSESSSAMVSHTAWITVLIPPSTPAITAEMEEPWVAGQEYTVTCTAPDAKPAAEVTLFRNGVELTDIDSFTMSGSEEKLLNTEAVVKFTAHSSDNGQKLVCRVKNPASPRPLDASLVMNVYYPPTAPVIEGLDSDEVKAGTLLKLVCLSYGGNPLATLHWTKNKEVLSTSWEMDMESQKSSSALTLQVTPEDNHAVLCCESVNQVSPQPLSLSRTLHVLFEPTEVKVLGSFEAVEGKEVNLCCYTTSSNPPVQIRWWLGFRELNDTVVTVSEGNNGGMATMSNLTHRVSQEENGLPLTCEAFNKGTRFSKTQSSPLQVFYPPQKVWMDAPPPGVALRSGNTVRLVCFSSGGNPTGRLTWFKGKTPCDNQRAVSSQKSVSRELVLVLQPSDNMATYRCEATNQAKKVLSVQTQLRVQFPAINVKITTNQKETRRGETLRLECISGSSNPKANISWSLGAERLKGVDQAPKKAEYGGVSVRSVLSLPLYSQHNGRRVTCQAFSSLLSEGVNTFYKLNVLYPPEFGPDQSKVVQAVEDDIAHLPLKVSANPDEISCEWIYRGQTLIKERDERYHWRGDLELELEIWNVTRRDSGNYTVVCKNDEGENRTTVNLDVHYAPSVKARTDPTRVDLGQTADLECVAEANPVVTGMFSWEWLGVDDDLPGSQKEDGDVGWLTIPEVTRFHSGRYRCTVKNGIAPPASADIELIVRFKPEIKKGPQWSKVASRGDGTSTAEVICQAEGIPKVDFTWAKNNITMDFTNPRYLERTLREGLVHTSTVTIVNVSAALDYAVFTCTARNTLGEDRLDIQLLSTNHPDPPSDLKLVSITQHTVTLQWTAGFDGGLEQKFRVRYRWPDSVSYLYMDVFPPKDTSFTVTGLYPGTTYNFSVNAINAIGESQYADDNAVLTVTTRDPSRMPLSLVVTLAVVGGVLLLLNPLGCFLGLRWWRRRRGLTGNREGASPDVSSFDAVSTVTELNRYEGGELINLAARRTLLADSGSEPGSSVYESYGGESGHYYYPTSDFRPTLYPHTEGPDGRDGGYSTSLGAHIYEDGAYQRRRRELPDQDPPIRVYGSLTDHRLPLSDSELPFELRGELV